MCIQALRVRVFVFVVKLECVIHNKLDKSFAPSRATANCLSRSSVHFLSAAVSRSLAVSIGALVALPCIPITAVIMTHGSRAIRSHTRLTWPDAAASSRGIAAQAHSKCNCFECTHVLNVITAPRRTVLFSCVNVCDAVCLH